MVSIILVNYNGSEDTMDCIKSLEQISYTDYRIIVVDNFSTDSSYAVLEEFNKTHDFVLLQAGANEGFSAGNNVGIKYALDCGTDYVLLLNNDTVVEKDFLEYIIKGFEIDSNVGVSIGKILYYSQPNTIWYAGGSLNNKTARTEHWGYGEENNDQYDKTSFVTFATGCCMCISRKTLEQVGLLDESFFLYEEDVEYCKRVTDAGFKMVYEPKSVIYHKVSASTGQGSRMSQYYLVRNKYSFVRGGFCGLNKLTAYLYCTALFAFRCIKGEMKVKYCLAGYKAFLRKEKGRALRF